MRWNQYSENSWNPEHSGFIDIFVYVFPQITEQSIKLVSILFELWYSQSNCSGCLMIRKTNSNWLMAEQIITFIILFLRNHRSWCAWDDICREPKYETNAFMFIFNWSKLSIETERHKCIVFLQGGRQVEQFQKSWIEIIIHFAEAISSSSSSSTPSNNRIVSVVSVGLFQYKLIPLFRLTFGHCFRHTHH